MLIALFGPTGVGKSEAISRCCATGQLSPIRPDTTRKLREGETEKNYVDLGEFNSRVNRGEYSLVTNLFGANYGAPTWSILEALHRPEPSHIIDYPLEHISTYASWEGHKLAILLWLPRWEELERRLISCNREARVGEAFIQWQLYREWLNEKSDLPKLRPNTVLASQSADAVAAEILACISVSTLAPKEQ